MNIFQIVKITLQFVPVELYNFIQKNYQELLTSIQPEILGIQNAPTWKIRVKFIHPKRT